MGGVDIFTQILLDFVIRFPNLYVLNLNFYPFFATSLLRKFLQKREFSIAFKRRSVHKVRRIFDWTSREYLHFNYNSVQISFISMFIHFHPKLISTHSTAMPKKIRVNLFTRARQWFKYIFCCLIFLMKNPHNSIKVKSHAIIIFE